MKLIFIILGVVFFLVAVNGRHLHETDSEEDRNAEDSLQDKGDQSSSRSRHRRRSRKSYFDYNYSAYYDNRKEISHLEDIYSEILNLLDEMTSLMKRPPTPPPPHPIYIPYPVPYPVPKYLPCELKNCNNNKTGSNIPNLNERINSSDDDDESDEGVRPISFVPIVPKGLVNEAPEVEHGSVQAGMETTTRSSVINKGTCQVGVITCCNLKNISERQGCFEKYDCTQTFPAGLSCNPDIVRKVFQEFITTYSLAIEN